MSVTVLLVIAACDNDSTADRAASAPGPTSVANPSATESGARQRTVPFQTASEPAPDTAPADPDSAIDGPVIRHPRPSTSDVGMSAEVRGRLELDRGCLYVALDEAGERYPILWPAGTRWDAEQKAVTSPTGESMVVGDEIYGGGGYLYVADVERLAGSRASWVAAACVDNTYGEIAVVNNSDTAIGPALVADFEVEVSYDETGTTVCPVLETRLVDRSIGDPERWVWELPNGTTITDQNPELPHGVSGDVTLTVSRAGDTASVTKFATFREC